MSKSAQDLRLAIHRIDRDMAPIQQMLDETGGMEWFYQIQDMKKERQRLVGMLSDVVPATLEG